MRIEKYNGIIIEKIKPTDYLAGGVSGIQYEETTDGNWKKYLPSGERQKYRFLETYACVSFSALNAIEIQMNRLIMEKLLPLETMLFLNESGYISEDGKFNASDRYLAKLSETTNKGNSLQKVCDTLRHQGVLPERNWSWEEDFNWNEYYAEIPQTLKDKAMKFYDYFDIQYEWVIAGLPSTVELLKKHLKQAPLQIASSTCSGWSSGNPVQKCDLPINHATIIYNIDNYIRDFDSYPLFKKSLALNYYIPYVMKIVLIPKIKKIMKYIIVGKEHYLLDDTLKMALNIGDEIELARLRANGLLGEPVAGSIEGYTIYPLIQQTRLKDLFGL